MLHNASSTESPWLITPGNRRAWAEYPPSSSGQTTTRHSKALPSTSVSQGVTSNSLDGLPKRAGSSIGSFTVADIVLLLRLFYSYAVGTQWLIIAQQLQRMNASNRWQHGHRKRNLNSLQGIRALDCELNLQEYRVLLQVYISQHTLCLSAYVSKTNIGTGAYRPVPSGDEGLLFPIDLNRYRFCSILLESHSVKRADNDVLPGGGVLVDTVRQKQCL